MYSIILITSIIILVISLILWVKTSKLKKDLKEKAITEIDWKTKQVEEAAALKQEELHKAIEENELVIQQQEKHKQLLLEKGQQLIDKELDNYKFIHKNEVENEIYHYKSEEFRKIDVEREKQKREIEKEKYEFNTSFTQTKKNLEDYLTNRKTEINDEIVQLLLQKSEIEADLDDFRSRRAAVNEAIRREEETQNEIDFHRIILSENDKEDIKYLLSIEDKINNKTLLRKLIWSEYLQKPFNSMINNIFGAKIPKNVIYCIENIKTHKKYIGKTSTEASKRWTEHIKTSLNIGSAKKSAIHDALYKHWDEFTFSILETTTKDELSNKEKFYIKTFETDKFGYNMNKGG